MTLATRVGLENDADGLGKDCRYVDRIIVEMLAALAVLVVFEQGQLMGQLLIAQLAGLYDVVALLYRLILLLNAGHKLSRQLA